MEIRSLFAKMMQDRTARYIVLALVACALSVLLSSKDVRAQDVAEPGSSLAADRQGSVSVNLDSGRNNTTQGLSAESDANLYKQLLSGKKLMQEREYVKPDKPTVYLTFDDGPSKLTPQVLDILKKEQVLATFFVCGDQISGREDTLKRIAEEGHAIGNHSFDHEYTKLYGSSFQGFWDQIQRNERLIEDTVGIRPSMIRAPGGTGTNFDAFYFYWLDQAGYTIYDWDIDSGDSRRVGVPAEEIISTVKKSTLGNEVTVLLHDGSGHSESVKALEAIIKYFKDKGYTFAPLSDKVKPAQFGVAKSLKWKRNVGEKEFIERHGQMLEFADARHDVNHDKEATGVEQANGTDPVNAQPVNAEPPAIGRLPEKSLEYASCKPAVKLTLSLPFGKDRSIDMGSYAACFPTDSTAAEVPLRDLAERLGAQVVWNDGDQSVRIRYGIKEIQYDTVNQMIRVQSLEGHARTSYWPYIRWVKERLYISIDRLFELFDQPAKAVADGNDRIRVEFGPAFDWNQHFPGKGNLFVGEIWKLALLIKRYFFISAIMDLPASATDFTAEVVS